MRYTACYSWSSAGVAPMRHHADAAGVPLVLRPCASQLVQCLILPVLQRCRCWSCDCAHAPCSWSAVGVAPMRQSAGAVTDATGSAHEYHAHRCRHLTPFLRWRCGHIWVPRFLSFAHRVLVGRLNIEVGRASRKHISLTLRA